MTSTLSSALAAPVSMARILGFGFTMVTGGNDTVTGLLGAASQVLSEHPEAKARLAAHPEEIPKAVEEFKGGKENAINALKGQVMKATRGQANPKLVDEILRRLLAS